ncbi:MAG: glycosyltransferase [Marinilabiliaceae bacterium]|nr:glycosyltransferase [Marinilabiliaceae bacterium]
MNKVFEKYLKRHPQEDYSILNADYRSDIIVVIPAYLEENFLIKTLQSLKNTLPVNKHIEIVVVINFSETDNEINKAHQRNLSKLTTSYVEKASNDTFYFSVIDAYDLPGKYSGAGLARKIGMDYAVNRFAEQGKEEGIIVSLDADCTVASNYFQAIDEFFYHKNYQGGAFYFEHHIDDSENSIEVCNAISQYELHLRYYIQVLRWSGFPFAFHTIGSCFAITAERYVRAGGMPRKQAGEDFYFLQKAIPMGQFGEIANTCVYPSARLSDRVPFGTGPSVRKLVDEQSGYFTYNLQAFIDLKELFEWRKKFYKLDRSGFEEIVHEFSGRMRSYLIHSDFFDALSQVSANCSHESTFEKRFWEVFNAFRVFKYLNYVHEHFLEKIAIFDAALDLLELIEPESDHDFQDINELLEYFRQKERSQPVSYSV